MWEINLNHQALTVLLGVFMGAVFCLLFDTFKALRIFLKLKTAGVFITDIIFFTIAAPIEFCFLLSRSCGEIRGFILVAEAVGFFCLKYTFSKIYLKILLFIFKTTRKIVNKVNGTLSIFLEILWNFGKKILKKSLFSRKKA